MENLIELKKQRAELDRKIYMLECTECPLKEGDEFWYVDQFGNIEHRIFGNIQKVENYLFLYHGSTPNNYLWYNTCSVFLRYNLPNLASNYYYIYL